MLMCPERQLDHVAVPGQRFLPLLQQTPLSKPCTSLFLKLTQCLNRFILLFDSLVSYAFLGLVDSHSDLDQPLDLLGQHLVAHVALVVQYLLPQRPSHLDAVVL